MFLGCILGEGGDDALVHFGVNKISLKVSISSKFFSKITAYMACILYRCNWKRNFDSWKSIEKFGTS
jgi:hypothetical protein